MLRHNNQESFTNKEFANSYLLQLAQYLYLNTVVGFKVIEK